jgi:hypothetical protein
MPFLQKPIILKDLVTADYKNKEYKILLKYKTRE